MHHSYFSESLARLHMQDLRDDAARHRRVLRPRTGSRRFLRRR
jgi:hypothetical protein